MNKYFFAAALLNFSLALALPSFGVVNLIAGCVMLTAALASKIVTAKS